MAKSHLQKKRLLQKALLGKKTLSLVLFYPRPHKKRRDAKIFGGYINSSFPSPRYLLMIAG